MLRYTLSYDNAEMFRILKYCCFITCLVTLLSYSPIYNVAEAYFLLFCTFKKHDFEEKIFFQKQDFEEKFFSKKHDFEWKRFCKKRDFE